jgi:hypothetical protein
MGLHTFRGMRIVIVVALAAMLSPALGVTDQGGDNQQNRRAPIRRHRLKVNLRQEREVQNSWDEGGHGPWRLDPILVAAAILADRFGEYAWEKSCHALSTSQRRVVVRCIAAFTYEVVLERLVRSDGIWTAVEIDEL